jgi:hypothetical protein
MSTLWTILGGLLLLMSTCACLPVVLLVVGRPLTAPWRGVTRGEVAAGVAAGLRAVLTGLGWVLRGFGVVMRWAVIVSGVTALAAAATLRIFPDLPAAPPALGSWAPYAAFGARFYLLLPLVAIVVTLAMLAAFMFTHPPRSTVAPPRTAPIPVPRSVRSAVLVGKTAAEAERRRREEIDTRPDVTADGALAWLHTAYLRDVAGPVLAGHEDPARVPAAAPPPRRAGGIADCPRCTRPVWTVDGTPAGHYPYRGARRACPAGRP